MADDQTTIYFNPKCSKCNLTLGLLKEKGKDPEVVEYLDSVPSKDCLLYTSPSPRDQRGSRMPSSA